MDSVQNNEKGENKTNQLTTAVGNVGIRSLLDIPYIPLNPCTSAQGRFVICPNKKNYKSSNVKYKDNDRRNYQIATNRSTEHLFGTNRQTRDIRKHGSTSLRFNENRIFGFKKLQELLGFHPEEIPIFLIKQHNGFTDFLRKDYLSPDIVVLTVQMIARACESNFVEMKKQMLEIICRDFLDHLASYLLSLPLQESHEKVQNKEFWDHVDRFWACLLTICEAVMRFLPRVAQERLPKVVRAFHMALMYLQKQGLESQNTLEKIEKLDQYLINAVKKIEREFKEKTNKDYVAPPNDFRSIALFPTKKDIKQTSEEVFLRPNIIDGKYFDCEHYLDIQFRLTREDFVAPLREGIEEYIDKVKRNGKVSGLIGNVRVYPKTKFLFTKCISEKVCILVDLGIDRGRYSNLANSKRLIFGSMVAFSRDHFHNVFFGTVANRDEKIINAGKVAIELQSNFDHEHLYGENYVMIESELYFEPYYQVLQALKSMEVSKFPMKQYIIDVQSETAHPKYVKENPHFFIDIKTSYNSEINTSDEDMFHEDMLANVQSLNNIYNIIENKWPTQEELELDESQYNALKAALTHEFCVIQGPPGTGKTYLGLRIIKIILDNYKRLHGISRRQKPILIVCYSNHALDQFLEGILKFTGGIIRVGSRSNNERLNSYNLKEFVHKRRLEPYYYELRDQMRDIKSELDEIEMFLTELDDKNTVFDFAQVFNCSMKKQDRQSWIIGGTPLKKFRNFEQPINVENTNASEYNAVDPSEDQYDEVDYINRIADTDDLFSDTSNIKPFRLMASLWKINVLEIKSHKLRQDLTKENLDKNTYSTIQYELQRNIEIINYLKFRFAQKHSIFTDRKIDPAKVNINLLSGDDRWNLYWNWCKEFKEILKEKNIKLERQYRTISKKFAEARAYEEFKILRDALVIGMTTSYAAKHQTTIRALNSEIVIVEEAAKVSESHVVVSMTSSCEHLILIGDHKQLRPSTASYKLARQYNLNISLFERMVRNGMHCSTLDVQHRMRPEIVQLIVPVIYQNLQNHDSVNRYPAIRGMDKNIFFVTHTEYERENYDSMSKRNDHEANFILRLCKYLLQQGYEPSDITILTIYNGQMFLLRKKRDEMNLPKNVRITVVDNFQGEEANIILLSLVRSNKEGKIGFLAMENRICVTLSRAKHGFYIIGNMDVLKKSEIWSKVNNVLEKQDLIGPCLKLHCSNHYTEYTEVEKDVDFDRCLFGGCSLQCNDELQCGHQCKSVCHTTDEEHLEYKCTQPCTRQCIRDHACKDVCYKVCKCGISVEHTLKCGHNVTLQCHEDPDKHKCKIKISMKLESCGHDAVKECWIDPENFKCMVPCSKRLLCGHQCTATCHVKDDPEHLKFECQKKCERKSAGCIENHQCKNKCHEKCSPCDVLVRKMHSDCSHTEELKCSADIDAKICEKLCRRNLPCGHHCKKFCWEFCDPLQCKVKVNKEIPECKHLIWMECGNKPNRIKCKKVCPLVLDCGHMCGQLCSSCVDGCKKECEVLTDHSFEPACQHIFKIPCFKRNKDFTSNSLELLRFCTQPCGVILKCGHVCSATCGLCVQGALHQPCKQSCNYPLLCGHKCASPCREKCPPCMKKCTYKCRHNECPLKCGEPCILCIEPCIRHCKHGACTRKCYELCDKKPCDLPCEKKLQCGHNCIGFCGDPCPQLCRICNVAEVTKIFFGNEEEPDARFVLLEDCNHFFEATSLEKYLEIESKNDAEIKIKVCPLCKSPIYKTQRYTELAKAAHKDIAQIKRIIFGKVNDVRTRWIEVLEKTNCLKKENFDSKILKIFGKISLFDSKSYKFKLNIDQLTVFEVQIQAITQISLIKKEVIKLCQGIPDLLSSYIDILINFLLINRRKISNQEIYELDHEINRLHLISKLFIISSLDSYKANKNVSSIKTVYEEAFVCATKIGSFDDTSSLALEYKIKSLQDLLKETGILEEEKRQIITAMKHEIKQGAWFKCPNGHYYAIGDCGGATVVSKCNECGQQIGGTNHSLLSTNVHAPDFDNSRYPAWSSQANMNNYMFDFN